MLRRTACVLCAAAVVAGLSGGCRKLFIRENFETVYEGQPADAVARTLGKPDLKAADVWIYVNERPDYYRAEIHFRDGLVTKKKWSDTREPAERP